MVIGRDSQWYAALIQGFHTALVATNVTGYRWADSDGWSLALAPHVDRSPYRHLEFWFDLGAPSFSGSEYTHASSLSYAVRYQPDDDATSQAILHASIASVAELLAEWTGQGVCRTSFIRATVEGMEDGWIGARVDFTLRYPWRA